MADNVTVLKTDTSRQLWFPVPRKVIQPHRKSWSINTADKFAQSIIQTAPIVFHTANPVVGILVVVIHSIFETFITIILMSGFFFLSSQTQWTKKKRSKPYFRRKHVVPS